MIQSWLTSRETRNNLIRPWAHLVDPSCGLESAHDCGLAFEKVLHPPRLQSSARGLEVKWGETWAITFSPRMSWTPLSTSARDRYPFPLGSNCRKSSSRSAFSGSLFPMGSFAAHALQHMPRHPRKVDSMLIAARHAEGSRDLKSLLLPAMAPPPLCSAPKALPADPGVDRRGVGWPGVRRGGSGLAPWALAPWLRPTGLGLAPRTLLPRPGVNAAAATTGLTATSARLPPMMADGPPASPSWVHRCCLMAQVQNSSNRICPPPFLRHQDHHQSEHPIV